VKKSFKALGEKAKSISDEKAREVWARWNWPTEGLSESAILSAVKIYLVLKEEVENNPSVKGAGINCLNESFYSDTTPCLAWCMLFAEKELIWACEGDLMTLLTKFILYRTLRQPVMMSNVYPFLMGQAALKHERIAKFPEVTEPENHLLIAHCGYFGLMPPSFASNWVVRPKVLAIVDENAHAVDARFPEGSVTLVKLDSTLEKIFLVEGILEGYAQYPGSDCRNGGIIRIPSGRRLMAHLPSHHMLILTGHHGVALENVAKVLDVAVEEL
jgi:L-fucose isomerase-like protein